MGKLTGALLLLVLAFAGAGVLQDRRSAPCRDHGGVAHVDVVYPTQVAQRTTTCRDGYQRVGTG